MGTVNGFARVESLEGRRLLSAAGPFDPSFGSGGIVSGTGGPLKMLPDGKFLVDVNGTGVIRRYKPDGTLDLSFEGAGAVDDWKRGVARQADGKLLVLADGVLTRYNADKSVDTTFGTLGSVSSFYTNGTFKTFEAADFTLWRNRIVVAGIADSDFNVGAPLVAVEELDTSGVVDRHFGIHYAGARFDPATMRVKTSAGGMIYVAGSGGGPVRFAPVGGDNSTGETAPVSYFNEFPGFKMGDMAVGRDGKVVLAGSINPYFSEPYVAVIRMHSNLALDESFGLDALPGIAKIPLTLATGANAVGIGAHGGILLGATDAGGTAEMMRLVPTLYHVVGVPITGHVFHDVNEDGIEETGEAGIRGVRVFMAGTTGRLRRGVITDADGNFTINDPQSNGPVDLVQATNKRWSQSTPASGAPFSTDYSPDTGTDRLPVFGDVAADRSSAVMGRVTSGPYPMQGWVVYLDVNHDGARQPEEPSAVTGWDGGYEIRNVRPGRYDLRDEVRGGWRQASPPAPDADPASGAGGNGLKSITLLGGRTLRVNFVEQRVTASRISGIEFLDANGNGRQDPGEPGTHVGRILIPSDQGTELEATYDKNGRYFFEDLPAGGSFDVFAYVPPADVGERRSWTNTTPALRTIRLPAGGADVRNLNFGVRKV